MLSRLHAHWASEPYKTLQHAVAVCVALILIFAALVKVGNLPLFARAVASLIEGQSVGGAAPPLSLTIAAVVFAMEISIGIALLLAPSEHRVRCLGAFLFVAFAAVQFRLLGMESGTPCGCFVMLQGAVFLEPFSTPHLAIQTNLVIASGLASIFVPIGGSEPRVEANSKSWEGLSWLAGAFLAVGIILGRYQNMLWGDPNK